MIASSRHLEGCLNTLANQERFHYVATNLINHAENALSITSDAWQSQLNNKKLRNPETLDITVEKDIFFHFEKFLTDRMRCDKKKPLRFTLHWQTQNLKAASP
uniref:Uncharacterized protein n=1 Tax=Glossina pallidipes TaxID=7398 RepID=A0A1B0AK78_GLOPL